MFTLARKHLIHDKVRLVVTLVGIVFALVLILIQFGLFLSFMDTSANIVEHSGADLWISSPKIPHVNGGSPLPESQRGKALQVPGVERADRFILAWVPWKLPSGAVEQVQVAGFRLDGSLGRPWSIVAGSLQALRGEDTVIVDEIYKEKLGVTHIGQVVEIVHKRARVVGFTHGIRSFTTWPYVFTNFKNAQNYAPGMTENDTVYFHVKVATGYAPSQVRESLKAMLPQFDVYTNDEMLSKTRTYWVFQTGAGVTTLLDAILGLIVGTVVVAQADLLGHSRPHPRIRHVEGHGRLQHAHLCGDSGAGRHERGYRLRLRHQHRLLRFTGQPERQCPHCSPSRGGSRHALAGCRHVRRSVHHLHPESHHHRPGDGLSRVTL